MPDSEQPPEPVVRVVDRRWWAQPGATPRAEEPSLKPSYVEQLERQLAEKDEQLQNTIARYRTAAAEFDDARARLRKEVAKDVERGRRAMLAELLEVVDNLDRALEAPHESDADAGLRQGVELVRQQFLSTLEGFGVTRITSLDQPFDPTRHEAVTTVPVSDPSRDHIIVGVIKHGYAIGDEVLRPAQVAVSTLQK